MTEGKGGGKVQWKDLKLTTSVVTADQKGNRLLGKDPRISDGKVGHVTVTVPSQPNVAAAELDGSIDPNNPSPGGNGSNGTNGSDGEDGGPGGNAPPVQLMVALRSGDHPLLEVSVSALGKRRLYLVDLRSEGPALRECDPYIKRQWTLRGLRASTRSAHLVGEADMRLRAVIACATFPRVAPPSDSR